MSGGDPSSTPASSTKSQATEEKSPASGESLPETGEKSTACAEKPPEGAPVELPGPDGWTKRVRFHGSLLFLPKKRSTKWSDETKAAKQKKGKEDNKLIEEEKSDDQKKEMDEPNVGEGKTEEMKDDVQTAEDDEAREEKKDSDHDEAHGDDPFDGKGNEVPEKTTADGDHAKHEEKKDSDGQADASSYGKGNEVVQSESIAHGESKEITEELVTAGDDKTGEGKKGSGDDKGQSDASSDDGKGKEVLLDENIADGKNRNMEEEPNTVGDDKVVEEKKDGDDGKVQADGPSDEKGNEVAQDGNIASGQRGKTETSDVNDPVEHHALNEDKKVEGKEDNKSDQQGDKVTTGAAMQIEEEC